MADHGPLSEAVRHARHLAGGGETDERLLARYVAARDEAAFAEIVRRHGPAVRRLCRLVLGDEHLAEDAFQAAFLVLARKARGVRRGQALAGWLYRVAHRIAAAARASARRRAAREGQWRPAEARPADDGELVAAAVAGLPDRYRAPVVLCYLEGRTNEEAARELGWPVGTVKTSLHRARQRLRRWLEARGVALSPALLAPAGEGLSVELATRTAAFAAGVTAGVSPEVLAMSEGALRSMWTARLTAALAAVTLLLGLAGGVWALWPAPRGAPIAARPPLPEAKREPLFQGEHLTTPIKARGRVVFSDDGRQLAWLQGGKVYVAATADLVKAGGAGPKTKEIAQADERQEVLDAVFLPDGRLHVSPANDLVVGDGRRKPVSLAPGGKWLAVETKADEVRLAPVGDDAKGKSYSGVTFGGWGEKGEHAYLVTAAHDVERLSLADGKRTAVVRGEELAKLCEVKLGGVEVRAASGAGAAERVLLSARQAGAAGRGFGTRSYPVPKGAEKRGRNPGSAEPGPGPPTWSVLVAGGKPVVLSPNWKARHIDAIEVIPAPQLDRFLYAQMAQRGGAGDARDPEVWLGTIDTAGKKAEKKLERSPFPADWRELRWTALDTSADGKRALVLVTCHVIKKVPVAGPGDTAKVMAKYGRSGARSDGAGNALLKFQGWSLWSFDGEKGTAKQLTKLYGEKIGDVGEVYVALEGKLATVRSAALAEHVAYSRAAGVVALSLNTQTFMRASAESLAPLVLLRVPAW